MNGGKKIWKSTPLVVGAVFLALVTIAGGLATLYGAFAQIPYATSGEVEGKLGPIKTQIETLEKNHDKEIADIKEKQGMLEALKNQDNEWYREVAQEVAVLASRMGRVEKQLDRIEGLLLERK